MNILWWVIISFALTACTATPYKERGLDTTSKFRVPAEGRAGIYVYQWKTGILGAAVDVDFEIKGQPIISLNTGEYGYMELAPGRYEYKLQGGMFKSYLPVEFEANQNYFFAARLSNFIDSAVLVTNQESIDAAKENIASGRYEINTAD